MMNKFIEEVENALLGDLNLFSIEEGEIIDDDPEYYSVTVKVTSKDFEHEGVEHEGKIQYLLMQIDEGVPHLFDGEDSLTEVTALSIYQCLFWDLALTEKKAKYAEHFSDDGVDINDVKVGEYIDFGAGCFVQRKEKDIWVQLDGGMSIEVSKSEVFEWLRERMPK